jgi:hypothetical protein
MTTIRDMLKPGETAGLVGEWWFIRDEEGTVVRMNWAGGRELYDECKAIALEKFGITPIEIPLSAFGESWPSEETTP